MSGASGDGVFVTSWGWETIDDEAWRKWKVEEAGETQCYLLMPAGLPADVVLMYAWRMRAPVG